MQRLIQGIQTFMRAVYSTEKELFDRIATRQEPEVLFITCSDSRVDPSLLTQTRPGEMLVIRNAGNLVPRHGGFPSGEAGTVEFAIRELGVRHIVLCGHTDCGAMRALMDPAGAQELPALRAWLDHAEPTRRIVREQLSDRDFATQHLAAIEINTLVQIEHLRSHPSVREAHDAGRLKLHAWVWHIAGGEMRGFDAEQGKFVPLTDRSLPVDTGLTWPL